MITLQLLLTSVVTLIPVPVSGSLHNTLRYYELLGHNDIHVHSVTKRSLDGAEPIHRVTVNAFSRSFHLVLKHHRDFLSSDFSVVTVDSRGRKKPVFVDQNDFFTGYVRDEVSSHVKAYWEKGVLATNIHTADDEYTIEPSWRHLPTGNYSMIAYRTSDIEPDENGRNVSSYCESIHAEGGEVIPDDVTYHHLSENESPHVFAANASYGYHHSRARRAAPINNACPLMLVADYTFFDAIGRSSSEVTAKYLMHQMQKVDEIYAKTDFNGFKNMRIEVKSIMIHEAPQSSKDLHYNMERSSWPTRDLLEVFSKYKTYKNYCLVHLFTHRKFDKGVLGLAYIASPRLGAVGGICTKSYLKSGSEYNLNTGWSTSMNSFGKILISQQAYLVTAHELGHNWGSEHDPESCAPAAEKGGKFIMYPYAVAGYDKNNMLFSSCSRGFVHAVLASKSPICFKPKSPFFCGNGLAEEGSKEECDAGISGKQDTDKCCSATCKLRSGAQCSAYNNGCCKNCAVSPRGTMCFTHGSDDTTCLGNATCDGTSAVCPPRDIRAENSPCGDSGKCSKNGTCLVYCETIGKDPCACDEDANSCKWCCKPKGKAGPCLPEPTKKESLEDGRPCVKGYCENGKCIKTEKNLVVRLWDIIEQITIDKLVEFMRDNIVGTVIVLSLILWIPGSITITCLDKRRERKDREKKEWLNGRNRLFIRPQEEKVFTLRNVPVSRIRHPPAGSVVREVPEYPSVIYIPARSGQQTPVTRQTDV